MSIQDDETLQMYLEESLDHISDIENDLLAIEEDGADINEDLVNKVYRAAHSIKGGAGFMGLSNIKDLTHEMENILGKIRGREMIPTPDIVNVLLKAADALKDLLEDILNSNDMDISGHVHALQAVLEAGSAPPQKKGTNSGPLPGPATTPQKGSATEAPSPQDGTLTLAMPQGNLSITVESKKIIPLFDQSKFIYLVEMDVAADILGAGKTCKSILEEMEQTGTIISTNFMLQPSSSLDKKWTPDVPVILILFGSILKPGDINILFEIKQHQILELRRDCKLYRLDGMPADSETDTGKAMNNPVNREMSSQPTVSLHKSELAPPAQPIDAEHQETNNDSLPAPSEISGTEPVFEPESETAAADSLEAKPSKKGVKIEHDTSLRVHVSLLDQLMTLAGELVLSRNQLMQSITSGDQRGSEIAGQRIDLITSELQEAIMLTRMQSIGNVFNKFPRVVRDLAQNLGKQIELTLEGKDVELDKTIIEAIGDPLTHLVRNSVDHGIEKPDVRRRAGKNPTGNIFLKAYHEAGQVNIEITDDGKGQIGRAHV